MINGDKDWDLTQVDRSYKAPEPTGDDKGMGNFLYGDVLTGNWICPLCGPDCKGGAHRNAMIEDGVPSKAEIAAKNEEKHSADLLEQIAKELRAERDAALEDTKEVWRKLGYVVAENDQLKAEMDELRRRYENITVERDDAEVERDRLSAELSELRKQGTFADGFIDGREHGYAHCGSCGHAWEAHDGECGAYEQDGSICGCSKVIANGEQGTFDDGWDAGLEAASERLHLELPGLQGKIRQLKRTPPKK